MDDGVKAVIMAGGEGTRLRPLSLGRPKPMTPLFGKPVMEHIINLLRGQGIREICVTLCYQPQVVMDYFGSGEQLGVQLTYFVEEKPLGTAGSVKNCAEYLGDEDFLVISGDCVCNLALSRAVEEHKKKGTKATLVLYRHETPLEYGLVVTGQDGMVERFVEKPGWGQVVTDQINTGIYILSPEVLQTVPQGKPWDFGKDLFPAMLREGTAIGGCPLEGYWCDMGDCKAYLDCVCAALDGKAGLELSLPRRKENLWAAQPIPAGVTVEGPCWIGERVKIGQGAVIGPYAVLSAGSEVGAQAVVRRSVLLEEAFVGEQASLQEALLCRGAAVRKRGVLHPGTALGENALVEEDGELLERVRLWPGQCAPAGCRLAHSVTGGCQKGVLRFGDSGVIQGVLGEDLGPEDLVTLGGVLGREGTVGVGCSRTHGARMLARAAAAGVAAVGGDVVAHSLDSPVQGAGAAVLLKLPISLFVEEQEGKVYLHVFDSSGLPLTREGERKIEQALLREEVHLVRSGKVGRVKHGELSPREWGLWTARRAALHRPALRRLTVAVGSQTAEDRALREALSALGCILEEQWRPGIVAFHSEKGGFRLNAQDEKGAFVDSGQLLTLAALIEMENGAAVAAVPVGASAAVELVAAGYGGKALRLDRDGPQARELYAAQPWVREAPAAAVRICSRMGVSGQKLESLVAKTPRFSAWRREVPLTSDRGRVMQALAREQSRRCDGDGLRVRAGGGWVYLTPMARRSALRILAEGPDLELAAELCDRYAGRAAQLDREISEQCAQEENKK